MKNNPDNTTITRRRGTIPMFRKWFYLVTAVLIMPSVTAYALSAPPEEFISGHPAFTGWMLVVVFAGFLGAMGIIAYFLNRTIVHFETTNENQWRSIRGLHDKDAVMGTRVSIVETKCRIIHGDKE